MNGVKMTNPPNVRSRRKFQAGNVWEWVMGMVLISAGMLKKQQIRVETKLPRMLRVSGRLDFIVGSPENWKDAKENVGKIIAGLELLGLDVPPFFFKAIDKLVEKYNGKLLADVVLETKSLSSFMMEKVQKTRTPLYHHALQIFHYVYGNEEGINSGKLFYVGKDDCLMEEFDIENDNKLFEQYKADIKLMTKYYNAGFDPKDPKKFMPPVEPLVLFEEGVWKFTKNWNVEYSNFLTYLYGFETPEAYRKEWQGRVNSWNRVIKRAVLEGEYIKRPGKEDLLMKLTDKNKEAIADARKCFPLLDKYIAKAKAAGAFKTGDENDEDE